LCQGQCCSPGRLRRKLVKQAWQKNSLEDIEAMD
jgi:hypothetical protein